MRTAQADPSATMGIFSNVSDREKSENLRICRICLEERAMTAEHIPPKRAYNSADMIWNEVLYLSGEAKSINAKTRGGFQVTTICEGCNSGTCAPYAAHYVRWIKHLAEHRGVRDSQSADRKLFSIPNDVKPLMVAKEIATMILAIEGVTLARHIPELGSFVRDPKAKYRPPFKVYAFTVPFHKAAGTIAPHAGRLGAFSPGFEMHGGEISRWPFGFVYAWQLGNEYGPDQLEDITGWFWGESSPFVRLPNRLTVIDVFRSLMGAPRTRPQSELPQYLRR